MKPGIYYGHEVDYSAIEAVNISSLCWMGKSPKHYKHCPRVSTKPMSLGTAGHVATLEPERFASDYVIWDEQTATGRMSPRTGSKWDSFCKLHAGKEIITLDEYVASVEIARAIRDDAECSEVLTGSKSEVALVWVHEDTGILCKGRVDMLKLPMFADLKTAADISPGPFLAKAAKLHYHTRMAWYHDAIKQLTGMGEDEILETLILAVESGKPHDCACYWMPDEVLECGRTEYGEWMSKLKSCIAFDHWPGIAAGARLQYTVPKWCIDDPEDEPVAELGLDWSKT
jgi:hypothetical protein